MANQGPVILDPKSPLAGVGQGAASNVATAQAEAAQNDVASKLTGQTIFPERVVATQIVLRQALSVGEGVVLTDGCVQTVHLSAGSVDTDQLAAGAATFDKIDVTDLAAINANLGTVNAGVIYVGAGGIIISSDPDGDEPVTGLLLGASQVKLVKGGEITVLLDGDTGDATFTGTITASIISGMDTVNFGTDVEIGGDLIINSSEVSASIIFNGGVLAEGKTYIFFDTEPGYGESGPVSMLHVVGGEAVEILGGTQQILVNGSENYILYAAGYHRFYGPLTLYGDIVAPNLFSSMADWSPTISGTGISAGSILYARYSQVGGMIFYDIACTFTVTGTPNGVIFSPPVEFTEFSAYNSVGAGHISGDGGSAKAAMVYATSSTAFNVFRGDIVAFTAGTGRLFRAQGFYKA